MIEREFILGMSFEESNVILTHDGYCGVLLFNTILKGKLKRE